jgi:hypothetical protein
MQKGIVSAVNGRRARIVHADGVVSGWLFLSNSIKTIAPGQIAFYEQCGNSGLVLGLADATYIPSPGPAGGGAGQALVKKSGDDYDTQWATLMPVVTYMVPDGIMIQTDIPTTENAMFRLHLVGNNYGQGQVLDIVLEGYNYASGNAIINTHATALDYIAPVSVFCRNGFLCFWTQGTHMFGSALAVVQQTNSTDMRNRVTSLYNLAEPTDNITRKVVIGPKRMAHSCIINGSAFDNAQNSLTSGIYNGIYNSVWRHLINMAHSNADGYGAQIMHDYYQGGTMWHRAATGSVWGQFRRVMDPRWCHSLVEGEREIQDNENLNSFTYPGTYICPLNVRAQTLINCPTVGFAFKLTVDWMLGNSTYLVQAAETYIGPVHRRISTDGGSSWHDWIVYWTSSGALPTCPSGNNANGYYSKYANGVMECWGNISATNVTFPAAFSIAPTVVPIPRTTGSILLFNPRDITTTGFGMNRYWWNGSGWGDAGEDFYWIAIGRWW